MTDSKPITPAPAVEYRQCIWGDLIYGAKEQLQALGLGVGLPFPLEGSRCTLKVSDPRGFTAHIESASWRSEGLFSVSIPLFEDCPRPEPVPQSYAPGVTKCENSRSDEYRGTAAALAAAGLIELDQVPGQPGMRKVTVRILADGSVLGGVPTANHSNIREPGAKEIERAGAGRFRVRVWLTEEEEQQRDEREKITVGKWEQQILARARPAPLNEGRAVILARRSHLKLVWSALPASVL